MVFVALALDLALASWPTKESLGTEGFFIFLKHTKTVEVKEDPGIRPILIGDLRLWCSPDTVVPSSWRCSHRDEKNGTILGQEHPVTLTSKANLASTYRNQGPIAPHIFYISFKSTSIAASGGRHYPAGGRQAVRRATVPTNHPHRKPCPARDRTRKPPTPTPCPAHVRTRNAPAAIMCSFTQPTPQAVPST